MAQGIGHGFRIDADERLLQSDQSVSVSILQSSSPIAVVRHLVAVNGALEDLDVVLAEERQVLWLVLLVAEISKRKAVSTESDGAQQTELHTYKTDLRPSCCRNEWFLRFGKPER